MFSAEPATNSENEVHVQELDKLFLEGYKSYRNHAVNCKQLLPATLRDSSRHSSFQRVMPLEQKSSW